MAYPDAKKLLVTADLAGLLHEMDYSLQANRKTLEGSTHPDRDAQFHHLACPPQGRLRIAARHRLHQRLQIALQGCVLVDGPLAARSSPPDSLAACRLRSNLEFGYSANHCPARQAAGVSDRSYSAKAYGLGFGSCDQPPRALIQNASENFELARQTCFGVWHQCQYKTFLP